MGESRGYNPLNHLLISWDIQVVDDDDDDDDGDDYTPED